MKFWLWLVLLLTVLLLLGCLSAAAAIRSGVDSLDSFMNRLSSSLTAADWPRCRAAYTALWQRWQQVAAGWKIFINHEDMRDIEISLVELDTALRQRDATEAQRELAALRYYTRHVAENERLEWTNIF